MPKFANVVSNPKGPKIEKILDCLRDWTFQSRLKVSITDNHQTPIYCGEFWRSGLKISIEIENFKRDWKIQSRLKFFNLWALREMNALKTLAWVWIATKCLALSLSIFGNPWPCYRGHLGLSGRKLQIEFENGFPGPPGPGAQKCKTESKKSQNRLFFNYFDSFSTLFWTFWAPKPKGPGNPFSNSICNFRPEGPKWPL